MVNSVVKTSPLQGMASPVRGITLAEKPFVGKVNIRGNADDSAFTSAASSILGGPLPLEPNTVAVHGALTVFWLGPNEWLVHTPEDDEGNLIEALSDAFNGQHAAVTDVSDYYVVIQMRGAEAAGVLSRACPLDLHERAFKAGDCAQTVFAHASILLHKLDGQSYDVQVRWTYAQYLWNYFSEAAANAAA